MRVFVECVPIQVGGGVQIIPINLSSGHAPKQCIWLRWGLGLRKVSSELSRSQDNLMASKTYWWS
jgi:hypothetical protein